MTEERIRELAREYQELLGLRDWTIDLRFLPAQAMDGNCASATVRAAFEHAVVEMCHPEQVDPDNVACREIEVSLVHELVHVRLWLFGYDHSGVVDKVYEALVERLAKALVGLRRRAELAEHRVRVIEGMARDIEARRASGVIWPAKAGLATDGEEEE